MNTRTRSTTACAQTALLLTLALAGCSKPPPRPVNLWSSHQQSRPPIRRSRHRSARTTSNPNIRRTSRVGGSHKSMRREPLERGTPLEGRTPSTKPGSSNMSARQSTGAEHEEVEFDLHGAIKQAQGAAGSLSTEEISAIRSRAELLRSHALTQEAVQSHQTKSTRRRQSLRVCK